MTRRPIELPENVASRIRGRGGAVTFAEFAELVLADPEVGYYAQALDPIGPRGDFTTAPVKSPGFVRGLARFLRELVGGLATVAPGAIPAVVELGAGTGDLAAGVLDYWRTHHPDLRDRVSFRLVDVSPGLRERQAVALSGFAAEDWDVGVAREIAGGWTQGVVYANELLDALPFHLVRLADTVVEEAWVVSAPEGAYEEWRRVGPEASAELELLFGTAAAPDLRPLTADGRFELRPAVDRLFEDLAGSFSGPVCAVWIDYGDWLTGPDTSAEETGEDSPDPVAHGSTARGYFKHRRIEDPYRLAGRQDFTADVDFRALDLHGSRHGFDRLFLTSLAAFLHSVGVAADLDALRSGEYSLDRDAEASVLAALLDEGDVGGLFKVMVQVRES